jgi:FlaA1/EpsC-like NDP-sugar epimerase
LLMQRGSLSPSRKKHHLFLVNVSMDQVVQSLPKKALWTGRSSSLKSLQSVIDFATLCGALVLAYLLRFDFSLSSQVQRSLFTQLLFIVPTQMLVLRLYGVHNFIWRFTSISDAKRIVAAFVTAALPFLTIRLTMAWMGEQVAVPISIIILDFCMASIGLMVVRLLRRELYENHQRIKKGHDTVASGEKKPVILVGAGQAGVMTLAEIKRHGHTELEVVGFVDDDKAKHGAVINGVKVLGSTERLPTLVKELDIDHVIVSFAQASRNEFQRVLTICREIPIRVRTIPGMYELLQEKVSVSRIREIQIEDLLGRSPVQLDRSSMDNFVKGKVVMITGAGGSIGSELVRQLASCETKELVLIERSEFNLFEIERELKYKFPSVTFRCLIADICDRERMRQIFRRFGPEVIFHAAAYKHVPMMEDNAPEALKNNVIATSTVANLAGHFGAEAFVLISSDKAVQPSSVMGATKRLAELVIQDLKNKYDTRFVAVRFGNVVGSTGSVIPIFREQIRQGGPVTVTHPDMQRFFMTTSEATQLVMQAGALGKGGEIFVLDMGEPVKIVDLARETIRLSGLVPDDDIQIEFTGVRPGEKLVEELGHSDEGLLKTVHPRIFIGNIPPYQRFRIRQMLIQAEELCISESNDEVRMFLQEFLPEAKIANLAPQKPKSKTNDRGRPELNYPLPLTATV